MQGCFWQCWCRLFSALPQIDRVTHGREGSSGKCLHSKGRRISLITQAFRKPKTQWDSLDYEETVPENQWHLKERSQPRKVLQCWREPQPDWGKWLWPLLQPKTGRETWGSAFQKALRISQCRLFCLKYLGGFGSDNRLLKPVWLKDLFQISSDYTQGLILQFLACFRLSLSSFRNIHILTDSCEINSNPATAGLDLIPFPSI